MFVFGNGYLYSIQMSVTINKYFLISLQSRARLELREEVTEGDARDVVDIMKYRCVPNLNNINQ